MHFVKDSARKHIFPMYKIQRCETMLMVGSICCFHLNVLIHFSQIFSKSLEVIWFDTADIINIHVPYHRGSFLVKCFYFLKKCTSSFSSASGFQSGLPNKMAHLRPPPFPSVRLIGGASFFCLILHSGKASSGENIPTSSALAKKH